MNQEKLHNGLNALIDAKYAECPDHVRERLKERVIQKADERLANGLDVTLHVFDKAAAPQQSVKFLMEEPENFTILPIDIEKLLFFKY